MNERDFEDIVCKYPDLIEDGLVFQGRQVVLRGKRADIVFSDKRGQNLIVELKKGIVLREHIAQLLDYEGYFLSKDDPTIRVMLIGNRVPENLKRSLDHHGLEWRELTNSFLVDFLKAKNDPLLQTVLSNVPLVSFKQKVNEDKRGVIHMADMPPLVSQQNINSGGLINKTLSEMSKQEVHKLAKELFIKKINQVFGNENIQLSSKTNKYGPVELILNNRNIEIFVRAKRQKKWPNQKGITRKNQFIVFVDFSENINDIFFIINADDWNDIMPKSFLSYHKRNPQPIELDTKTNTPIWINQRMKSGKPYIGTDFAVNDLLAYKEKWEKLNKSD